MSICQTIHSGLLVGISVIWRLRRVSGGRNEADGTLSWEMSVFPSLSLPCYPSRRRLRLRTPPMTLVPPYPSFPPLPFDPRCHPNSTNIFGELMYLQPGSNPCSSSHDWSLQTPLHGLFPSTLGMAPGTVLTPRRSSSSCTRLALPQPLVAFMPRVSSLWNVPQA